MKVVTEHLILLLCILIPNLTIHKLDKLEHLL